MPKETEFQVAPESVEEVLALCEQRGRSLEYKGVLVTDMGNGTINLYRGNRGTREQFRDKALAISRKASARSEPATAKQVAFLSDLIRRDPAEAMALGASSDGARVLDGMSKAEASRLIEAMKD